MWTIHQWFPLIYNFLRLTHLFTTIINCCIFELFCLNTFPKTLFLIKMNLKNQSYVFEESLHMISWKENKF
jgi:hypothetical protein